MKQLDEQLQNMEEGVNNRVERQPVEVTSRAERATSTNFTDKWSKGVQFGVDEETSYGDERKYGTQRKKCKKTCGQQSLKAQFDKSL